MLLFRASKSKRFWTFIIDAIIISIISSIVYEIILSLVNLDANALDFAYEQFLYSYQEFMYNLEYAGPQIDYTPLIESLTGYLELCIVYIPVNMASLIVSGFVYLVFLPNIWDKQTVGRALMKVKVVNQDGSEVGFGRRILRELVGYILIFEIIGTFDLFIVTFILTNVEGRSLTDIISKTELVSSVLNNYVDPEPVKPIEPIEPVDTKDNMDTIYPGKVDSDEYTIF